MACATETTFTGTTPFFTTSWNTANNWTSKSVPASGDVADVYKSTTVVYNVTTVSGAAELAAVQIAGSSNTSTAVLSLSTSAGTPYLLTDGLFVGAGVTGQNQTTAGAGFGQVNQSAGSMVINLLPNVPTSGFFEIDVNSVYSLSATGSIAAFNEQNAGSFLQNSGQNRLTAGYTLNNSGTYTDTNAGLLSADTITNTGTFNQAGGVIQGPTTGGANFTNSGTFLYSSGTFTGTFTNNPGAILNATGTSLPFNGTLINNGKLTVTNSTGTINTNLGGNGILLFSGTGTSVTLTGSNAYSGQTTVAAGTVILASPVGTIANNFGGALGGNVIINTNATLQNNADSQIANNSALTINGGTCNINNHDQTVGSLTMNAGLVQETTGPGLGVASGQVNIGNGTATITGGLRTNTGFTFNVGPTGTLNVIGSIGSYNSSSVSVTLIGGGTLSISGASPLSSIDVKQGTLQLSESGLLGSVNASVTVETGGTLSLTNQALTIGDLTGSGGVALGTGAITVLSTGSIFPGTIAGSGSFTKGGAGTLTLTGADSSSGMTTVGFGTLNVATTGSLSGSSIIVQPSAVAIFNGAINSSPAITDNGSLTFGTNTGAGILTRNIGILTIGTNTGNGNGVVTIAPAVSQSNRTLLIDNGVFLAGTTNAWTGKLDLSNNDMVARNSILSLISNEVKSGYNSTAAGNWQGNGITSSAAAGDTTHLTAVGVILNNDGTGNPVYGTATTLGLFDGYSPAIGDVLVKYTYVGDANLDGKIDGSDYSRIDNGFLHRLTGWYNGDFNYDGTVDGTDYTLIDNAFNMQGSSLTAEVASSVAGNLALMGSVNSVPEPSGSSLIAIVGATLLRRILRQRGPILNE